MWKYLLFYFLLHRYVHVLAEENIIAMDTKTNLKRSKRWDYGSFQVQENLRGKHKITALKSSHDSRDGTIVYSISGQGANSLFEIDSKTGDLYSLRQLDREQQDSYALNVSAHDLQGIEVEKAHPIVIEVVDKNDNAPQFSQSQYFATVKENSKAGTLVRILTATDKDDPNGSYGQLEYSILSSSGKNKFMVVQSTGEIKTTGHLDRERQDTYELVIQAKDDPGEDLSVSRVADTTLTIKVLDVNDNPPIFKYRPYKAIVSEAAEIGAKVLAVETTDADLGTNKITSYSIIPGDDFEKFKVVTVQNKGEIRLKQRLDYETSENHEYRFRVRAANVSPQTASDSLGTMEDTTEVVVRVTDVNEPPEFSEAEYTFSVKENEAIDSPLSSVAAKDPEGDSFSYWLVENSHYFFIDPRSGLITLKQKLDRELKAFHRFEVAAGIFDSFSTAIVNIRVLDVNDNPPIPLNAGSLQLYVCEDSERISRILMPNITMKDADSAANGAPFHYFPLKSHYYKHFKLVDNRDNTASLHALHNDFYVSDNREYRLPILVQDNGNPRLNATYQVTVQVCYCDHNLPPSCDAVPRAAGFHPVVLAVLVLFLLLLLIVVTMIFVVRRRRKGGSSESLLIKGSLSSSDEIQTFVSYTEEGGGEEDTAAFDLAALQRDCSSSVSGSQPRSRAGFSTPPSTKLSYMSNPRRRPYVPSQDIREFIAGRKYMEDGDDKKLAFDSLQVYGYEGESSEAGSLSSICSSVTDTDLNYDYLNDWGPRFDRLADMYGAKQNFPNMSAV